MAGPSSVIRWALLVMLLISSQASPDTASDEQEEGALIQLRRSGSNMTRLADVRTSSVTSWESLGTAVLAQNWQWTDSAGNKMDYSIFGQSAGVTFGTVGAIKSATEGDFTGAAMTLTKALLPAIKMANPLLGMTIGVFVSIFGSQDNGLAQTLKVLSEQIIAQVEAYVNSQFATQQLTSAKHAVANLYQFIYYKYRGRYVNDPEDGKWTVEYMTARSDFWQRVAVKFESSIYDVFGSSCLKGIQSPQPDYPPDDICKLFVASGFYQYLVAYANAHMSSYTEIARLAILLNKTETFTDARASISRYQHIYSQILPYILWVWTNYPNLNGTCSYQRTPGLACEGWSTLRTGFGTYPGLGSVSETQACRPEVSFRFGGFEKGCRNKDVPGVNQTLCTSETPVPSNHQSSVTEFGGVNDAGYSCTKGDFDRHREEWKNATLEYYGLQVRPYVIKFVPQACKRNPTPLMVFSPNATSLDLCETACASDPTCEGLAFEPSKQKCLLEASSLPERIGEICHTLRSEEPITVTEDLSTCASRFNSGAYFAFNDLETISQPEPDHRCLGIPRHIVDPKTILCNRSDVKRVRYRQLKSYQQMMYDRKGFLKELGRACKGQLKETWIGSGNKFNKHQTWSGSNVPKNVSRCWSLMENCPAGSGGPLFLVNQNGNCGCVGKDVTEADNDCDCEAHPELCDQTVTMYRYITATLYKAKETWAFIPPGARCRKVQSEKWQPPDAF